MIKGRPAIAALQVQLLSDSLQSSVYLRSLHTRPMARGLLFLAGNTAARLPEAFRRAASTPRVKDAGAQKPPAEAKVHSEFDMFAGAYARTRAPKHTKSVEC